MNKIRITKEFSFEMAHTLTGYDGACSEIHGHSYRLFVTVIGEPNPDPENPKYGMVMDFRALKDIVKTNILDRYDHAMMIRHAPQTEELIGALRKQFKNIHVVDYQPTCENLIARLADIISAKLPAQVKLHSLKLHETATSYAEWFAQDNSR